MAIEAAAPVWDSQMRPAAVRRRRTARLPGAMVLSVIVHGLVLVLAMWSVSNHVLHLPAGSSGGESGAVTVTLVGAVASGGGGQPKAPQTQSKATSALDAIFDKVRTDDAPAGPGHGVQPEADAAQLFREIAEAQQKAGGQHAADSQSNSQGASDGYDLWGRIRPCWRPASPVVVTLDIGVDSQGRLAWPPRPVRKSRSAPKPRELLAESMAVQAAVRCAPYHDAAPVTGAKTFRIVFAG